MTLRRLILLSVSVLLWSSAVAGAQEDSEPKLNEPTRPGTARPAEIQKAGVLQIDLGADSRLHAEEFHSEATTPVTLRYALVKQLAIEADVEPLITRVDEQTRARESGVGDTVVGAHWVGLSEAPSHPAVAVAYYAKLPTASADRQLGTGRVDDRLVLLLSKKIGETDVDFSGAYLNVGREGGGRVSGAAVAVDVSREFANHLGYVGELSHQSEDAEAPRGAYALGAVTYRVSERLRFDVGTRVGLSDDAPRISLIAGMSMSAPIAARR